MLASYASQTILTNDFFQNSTLAAVERIQCPLLDFQLRAFEAAVVNFPDARSGARPQGLEYHLRRPPVRFRVRTQHSPSLDVHGRLARSVSHEFLLHNHWCPGVVQPRPIRMPEGDERRFLRRHVDRSGQDSTGFQYGDLDRFRPTAMRTEAIPLVAANRWS